MVRENEHNVRLLLRMSRTHKNHQTKQH
jgi:hypothetical protein